MKIYKITNKVNGKVYIGQTKTSVEKRWQQHRYNVKVKWQRFKLQKAIEEFGAENFTVEQIDCAATKEEADEKEKYWISKYNSVEDGYNTSVGGRNSGANKKVRNVETGEVFGSMKEAASSVDVKHTSIWQAIKNPTWKCGGYHWELVKNG